MGANIIHIGFPKTATTFLQWNVFPQLKGIKYVDYKTCREIFQPIIYSDPLDYSIDRIKKKLIEGNASALYSFESLSGSPFYYKGIGRSNIPLSLCELGFEKVIITIRNQKEAIDSYYRQYVLQGGTLSFRNWLDMEDKRPIPQKYFQRGYLEYDKLILKYEETFGQENLLILSQESLKKDKAAFIRQIEHFTNSTYEHPGKERRAHVSLSNLSISLLRFINHFTYSSVRPFHFLSKRISNRPVWKIFAVILDPYFFRFISSKKSYLVKYQMGQRVHKFYANSNESLKKKWGIDFSEN